nr:MAG TPA: hypothetical protein [Caudoviricetes sp.]
MPSNHYILWFTILFMLVFHNSASELLLRHLRSRGTGPRPRPCPRGNRSPGTLPDLSRGWWVYRRYKRYDPRRKQ